MLEVKTARMSAMRNREQLSRQQYSSSERINIAIEVVATAQQQYIAVDKETTPYVSITKISN